MQENINTKRIAKNTLMLYIRQIMIMAVSLYTVREVLNVLGAADYGVYNVVAGVVTMFGFLSGAMATASQRYFSFELGRGNLPGLKKVFSVTLCIYLILLFIIAVLAETVGLWFVYTKLIIPSGRITAARLIYHFSVLNFMVTLVTTPYKASIIAHENMDIYAYVGIVEVVLKLLIVFLLKVLLYDKLMVYGILLFAVSLINTTLYWAYCKKHYAECQFKPVWDKQMFSELINFTGWSVFGAFTSVVRTQAITVLMNQFFNPVIIAARTVSLQVANALNVFSANFNTSLYAPIVKEYAANRKSTALSLIFNGCKVAFFLMWIFALPLYLRMEYVLTLWLKKLPEYVVIFTQLSIIEVVINSVSLPIMTAVRATGKVTLYELVLGTLQLLMFIASFIWIKFFNGEAVSAFYTAIILNFVMFFVRLLLVKRVMPLSITGFVLHVLIPIAVVSVISIIVTVMANKFFEQTLYGLISVICIAVLSSTVMMFFIGMSKSMRIKIMDFVIKKCNLRW